MYLLLLILAILIIYFVTDSLRMYEGLTSKNSDCPPGCSTKIDDAYCTLKLAGTDKAYNDCGQSCWSPNDSPTGYCQFDSECANCPRSRIPLGECSPYHSKESCLKHAACEWKGNFCVLKTSTPTPTPTPTPSSHHSHDHYFNEEKNKFIFNEYVGADFGDLAEFEIVEKTPKNEIFQDVVIAPENSRTINLSNTKNKS